MVCVPGWQVDCGHWFLCKWPLHSTPSASSQHGVWVSKASIPRQLEKEAATVIYTVFYGSTNYRTQGRKCRLHLSISGVSKNFGTKLPHGQKQIWNIGDRLEDDTRFNKEICETVTRTAIICSLSWGTKRMDSCSFLGAGYIHCSTVT